MIKLLKTEYKNLRKYGTKDLKRTKYGYYLMDV